MKFFVDTAKIEDIKKANDMGVICGVTTNPSLIAKEGGKSQEEVLKEIAEIRVQNPESSLVELGKLLEKPIGKSGVNHRLKKLQEIANELREEDK